MLPVRFTVFHGVLFHHGSVRTLDFPFRPGPVLSPLDLMRDVVLVSHDLYSTRGLVAGILAYRHKPTVHNPWFRDGIVL